MRSFSLCAVALSLVVASCNNANGELASKLQKVESDCDFLVAEAAWKTGGADAQTFCDCAAVLVKQDTPINADAISQTLSAVARETSKTGETFAEIHTRFRSAAEASDATHQSISLSIGISLADQMAGKARGLASGGDC